MLDTVQVTKHFRKLVQKILLDMYIIFQDMLHSMLDQLLHYTLYDIRACQLRGLMCICLVFQTRVVVLNCDICQGNPSPE